MNKWVRPYNEGRCTLPRKVLRKTGGVYLISDGEQLRYIGMSKRNAYEALYRHFQRWSDRYFERRVYDRNTHFVRVLLSSCPERLEIRLIKKYRPIDNREYYDWVDDTAVNFDANDEDWLIVPPKNGEIECPF